MFAMTATQESPVTRDDIEQALWRWTGWTADQSKVEDVLSLIDRLVESGQGRRAVATVQREAQDILARAREEAELIVQTMQDEAIKRAAVQKISERPHKGYIRAPAWDLPAEAYRDQDGALWVRIEASADVLAEGMRRCPQCQATKHASHYRRDRNSLSRRKVCRVCENSNRRGTRKKPKS